MGYFHSVTLDTDKCKGCTNCIKHCPTEAIRVRDGKAVIIDERCIDCGECIRRCPHQAKKAVTDPLDLLQEFDVKVAIPAPSFYGQFKSNITINQILTTLITIGFDHVYEVARTAEMVTQVIKEKLSKGELKKPAISSACPAVVRLIQVRFPELIDHVISVASPMELAARIVKEKLAQELKISIDKIGVFFISPCAAKVTSVKSPLAFKKSYVDGVIGISSIYPKMIANLVSADKSLNLQQSTGTGIGWASSGGESLALGLENYLSVDGSEHIIKVLEKLEMGKLPDIEFFEGHACVGGCVGGPLTVENSFVAKKRIRYLAEKFNKKPVKLTVDISTEEWNAIKAKTEWTEKLQPREVMKLDTDRAKALEKINLIEEISDRLPCGSCGAPTCRALAEDIVRGLGNEVDCIFKLREELRILAKKMVELSNKVPPAIGREENKVDDH